MHIPAHVLSFALAARPILCPAVRIPRGFTRTSEARPPSFDRLHTLAVARARVRRVGASFLRREAQHVRANRRNRRRRREGRLILAPLHTRAGPRKGEDHHVEAWLGERAAQCCGERCCRRGILLAFPPVRVRDDAKPRYAERAEAVQREVVGLEKCHERGELRDEDLRCGRDVHDIQERDVGVFRAI